MAASESGVTVEKILVRRPTRSRAMNLNPNTVKITGITGYIGFQTLVIALDRGYHVRGVVRNESSITDLKTKSRVIAQAHDNKQLEFAVVSDFLKAGAIRDPLDSITAIIHLASPLAIQVRISTHMCSGTLPFTAADRMLDGRLRGGDSQTCRFNGNDCARGRIKGADRQESSNHILL